MLYHRLFSKVSALEHAIDRHLLTVSPNTSLIDAIALMRQEKDCNWSDVETAMIPYIPKRVKANCVLVLEEARPVGLLTPQDAIHWIASHPILSEIKVRNVTTRSVSTLRQSAVQDIFTALSLLHQHQTSALLLENDQGQPIGLVTYESLFQTIHSINWEEAFKTTGQENIQESPVHSAKLGKSNTIALQSPNSQSSHPRPALLDNTVLRLALHRSENRYYALANLLTVGVFRTDTDGNALYVNHHWRELTGLSPDAAIENWSQTLHPEDRDHVLAEWQQSIRENRIFRAEYRFLHPNGTIVWVLGQATAEIDSNGDVTGYVGTITEISDRKQTENALQASESELQALLTAITDVIFVLDRQGRYLKIASTQPELLYETASDLLHKTLHEVFPKIQADTFLGYIQQALLTHQTVSFEYSLTINDTEVWFSANVSPLANDTVVLVARDITDRKQLENDLQIAKSELEDQLEERTEALRQTNRELREEIIERKQIEEALRQSEAKFQKMATNVPGMIYEFLLRADGSISFPFVSPSCYQIYELNAEQIQHNASLILNLVHPDDRPSFDQSITKSAETLQPWCWEGRIILPSGQTKWLQSASQPKRQSNGDILWDGLLMDVTDRKQVEEALIASEEHLRAIIEAEPECVKLVTADGTLLDMNAAGLSMIEIDQLDMAVGQSVYPLIAPEHRNAFQRLNERVCQGSRETLEFEIVGCKGTRRWMETHAVPLQNPDGQMLQLAITRDVTQRKQVEEALRQSERQLKAILNNIPHIAWLKDREGRFIAVNEPFARSCKMKTDDIVGKTDFDIWAPELAQKYRNDDLEVMASGQQKYAEEPLVNQAGDALWIETIKNPIYNEFNDVIGTTGIAQDITERKLAEQTLKESLEKEQELSELKSRFISMTSHEFRTPLAIVASSAGLLESYSDKLDDAKKLKHLHRIQASVKHMTQLLEDVLFISKADAKKLEFNPAPVDLVKFCRELADDLELAAPQHTIVFSSCCEVNSDSRRDRDGAIAPYHGCGNVRVDEKLLRQILNNLLSNAIKYSPPHSSIYLSLSYQQDLAIFQIKDEGIGIPKDDQDHLFESFHRASNVGDAPGTGLGLSVVKKCVNLHHGEIAVASQVGLGTTFTVKIPLSLRC
ncbi:MAG: PAS domain S-box protein [Elainellaceae cyanobacterium]